jgi:hypothetical protein
MTGVSTTCASPALTSLRFARLRGFRIAPMTSRRPQNPWYDTTHRSVKSRRLWFASTLLSMICQVCEGSEVGKRVSIMRLNKSPVAGPQIDGGRDI